MGRHPPVFTRIRAKPLPSWTTQDRRDKGVIHVEFLAQARISRPLTLVTGGAGFLGSHLCDRLLAEGHDVICLDNLITGRRENIQHLLAHPHFRFVLHDVTRPIDLPALLATSPGHRPSPPRPLSYILHFASPASPKDYARHPIHTLKVGALGTYHALGLAKAHGSVFLLASTSEIYGDPEISPQPEKYWGHVNPIGPRSVYDEAKRFAEAISMAYHREHGVKVRIVRIFNTYGERMRLEDGRALPNFMVQALLGKPLTVYGKGSQTRSLCYVSDLVEGLYRLLMSNQDRPHQPGKPGGSLHSATRRGHPSRHGKQEFHCLRAPAGG